MITVSTKAHITPENQVIVINGVPEGIYDVIVVLHPSAEPKKKRRAGFSKAKFVMAKDFNAPLEDFKDYME